MSLSFKHCLAGLLVLAVLPASSPGNAQTPTRAKIVAEFTGGSITRAEFKDAMLIRFRGRVPANPTTRRAFLRRYALLRIAAARGKAEGLEKTGAYMKQSALLSERVRIEAYRRMLVKRPARSVYRMMQLQILLLKRPARKGPPDGTRGSGESPELAAKARAIAAQLNRPGLSETEIEDILAGNTSSLRYKATGGFLSPQCVSCPWSQTRRLTSKLEKTPQGRFIYAHGRYGHMVARRLSTRMVRAGKLKDYFRAHYREQAVRIKRNIHRISDPAARARTLKGFPRGEREIENLANRFSDYFNRRETRGRFRNRIKLFKNARELRLYPAARSRAAAGITYKPETPLFMMSGRTFTYGDLTKLLPAPYFTKRTRLRRLQILVTHQLLSGSRAYERVARGKEYRSLLAYARVAVLGRIYYGERMPELPDVSEKEIRAHYEKHKAGRFRNLPYQRVRRRIMINLQEKAYRAARRKFDGKLARENKLRLLPADA